MRLKAHPHISVPSNEIGVGVLNVGLPPTGKIVVPMGAMVPMDDPSASVELSSTGVKVPIGEPVEKIEPTGARTPIGESIEKIDPTGVMVPRSVLVAVSLMPPIAAAAAPSCAASAAR